MMEVGTRRIGPHRFVIAFLGDAPSGARLALGSRERMLVPTAPAPSECGMKAHAELEVDQLWVVLRLELPNGSPAVDYVEVVPLSEAGPRP